MDSRVLNLCYAIYGNVSALIRMEVKERLQWRKMTPKVVLKS